MIGKKKKAKKKPDALVEEDAGGSVNAKPVKKPKPEKKPKTKTKSKAKRAKKSAASSHGVATKTLKALPVVTLVVLLAITAFYVYKISLIGYEEGEVALKSGRYLEVDIASANVSGNLLPPPINIPVSLLADEATQMTNPKLAIPSVSTPEEDIKLHTAPNMALVEEVEERILPTKSSDGEVEPWEYYGRPYTPVAGTKPISVIVTGIGIDTELSLAAAQLPAAISFAVSPYAASPNTWVKSLRVQGHECFMMLPVELSNYPLSDPGPKALQPSITPAENMDNLTWLLGQAIGYVGFLVPADEVFFAAQADFIEPVANELEERGLSLLFSQSKERPTLKEILQKEGTVYTEAHIFVRYGSDSAEINQQLEAAEAVAERGGHSLVVIEASPVALQELGKWAETLGGSGFQIVPASALARRLFS